MSEKDSKPEHDPQKPPQITFTRDPNRLRPTNMKLGNAQINDLAAEKRTLTVKFDEDQFKALLIAKVDQSDATEEEKRKVKEAILKSSTIRLQAALTEVTKVGISFLPHGFQWVQKLFTGYGIE